MLNGERTERLYRNHQGMILENQPLILLPQFQIIRCLAFFRYITFTMNGVIWNGESSIYNIVLLESYIGCSLVGKNNAYNSIGAKSLLS